MDGWKCVPMWERVRFFQPHLWKEPTNVLLLCPEGIKGLLMELADEQRLVFCFKVNLLTPSGFFTYCKV